jgi:tRNA pseudouridine55 synthase
MGQQDLRTSRPSASAKATADKQDLSGVLIVDKPEGPTSHDVVKLTRRAIGESRIGHTGTLDPMATGVLPLVIGRATRLAQFLTASDKRYDATIAFGRTTDTYDARGRELSSCADRPTRERLEAALAQFRGEFEQQPPAYSAKNIDGERSYAIARRASRSAATQPVQRGPQGEGESATVDHVRAKPVRVSARTVRLVDFDGDTAKLSMTVSAGFYVRSLASDLGGALGCGAVLVALRRTRSGEFGLDAAVPLADVLQSKREDLATRIIPISSLLTALPAVTLRGHENLERLRNGVEMGPADLVVPYTPAAVPEASPAQAAVPEASPEQAAVREASAEQAAVPEAPPNEIVRVLGADGDLVALARPGKTRGFLHGWVVLG